MTLVLGLDAGGTKTRVALADRQGGIAAHWSGPGLSPVGPPGWQTQLSTHLARALGAGAVEAAVLGLPFHGELDDISAEQVAVARQALGPRRFRVVNDVEAAFEGAFAGAPGILLLAGTGSMAWAGDGHRQIRIGGYGEAFGDEGSAHAIGRAALSRTSREGDGRAPVSGLGRAILQVCGTDASGLIGWAYGAADIRVAIAGLARTVSDLASAGDPVALAILDEAAGQLAEHVTAARSTLGRADLPWSHAGGVFASPVLRAKVSDRLGSPEPPVLDPLGGALLAAARLADWAPGASFITGLAASLAESGGHV